MNLVIGGSIGSATLTYEIIAVFGYLTFGNKVGVILGLPFASHVCPTKLLSAAVALIGWAEHHCYVPLDIAFYRRGTTCYRHFSIIFVSFASASLQKLPRQGIPPGAHGSGAEGDRDGCRFGGQWL